MSPESTGPATGDPSRRGGRLRVGFFGNFHPLTTRLSTTSIGLVILLSRDPRVESILVTCPRGSRVPEGIDPTKIHLRPTWLHDRPGSVVRAGLGMWRERRQVDVFLFNTYMTGLGRSLVANALGILLPVLLAKLTGKRVVVYMHNFMSTQQVETLGYRPGRAVRATARALESLLLRSTVVAVPLASQQESLGSQYGIRPELLFIPGLEGLYSSEVGSRNEEGAKRERPEGPPHILLFGLWGPQKDLAGALEDLGALAQRGFPMKVRVAGPVHPTFPEYAPIYERLRQKFSSQGFEFLGEVPERDLAALFRDSSVLLLPYRTTGGYSAVMNVGKAYGIPMAAYDLPELRSLAQTLGVRAEFFAPGDGAALERALRRSAEPDRTGQLHPETPRTPGADLQAGAGRLLALLHPTPW